MQWLNAPPIPQPYGTPAIDPEPLAVPSGGQELVRWSPAPAPVRQPSPLIARRILMRAAAVLTALGGAVVAVKWAVEAVAAWWHRTWTIPDTTADHAAAASGVAEHSSSGGWPLLAAAAVVLWLCVRRGGGCAGVTTHCGGCGQ
jgi:hypothetical protein